MRRQQGEENHPGGPLHGLDRHHGTVTIGNLTAVQTEAVLGEVHSHSVTLAESMGTLPLVASEEMAA